MPIQKGDKWSGYTFDGEWFVCDTCGHKCAGVIPMAAHSGECFNKDLLAGLKDLATKRSLTIDDLDKYLTNR